MPSINRTWHLLLPALLCLLFTAAVTASDGLTVYTVNYPLQYFAGRIAAGHARVELPLPPGADPASWMPDEATLEDYRKADLVLLNGAGYAKWTQQASLPHDALVDTSAGFSGGYIRIRDEVSGSRQHSGIAAVTWLDFHQAVQQAEAVMLALAKKKPQFRDEFQKNFERLREDLMALDLEMQKTVAGHPDQAMLASQPVYHYMARRYELRLEDLQWRPETFPDDAQWERLRAVSESFPALWMIWEARPLRETAAKLKAMDIDVLVFDPCAARPAEGDFLAVMRRNLLELARAYR